MFKLTRLSVASVIVAATFFVSSCKKNDNPAVDNDPTSAQDNATAEQTSNDIVNIAAQANENGASGTYRLGESDQLLTACATVTPYDPVTKKITVTFNGSVCTDGRTRNGSLTFDFSASDSTARYYRDPGFKCSVTSSGYTVTNAAGNTFAININNKTISNTTPSDFPSGTHTPANTNETWNITSSISITKPASLGGGTITWNCTRTKELLNTSDATVYRGTAQAINWLKARIGITGNANGTTAKGESFTVVVNTQLVRDFGTCGFLFGAPFIQGTLTFTPGTKYPRYVDYGNGTCDDAATVTINGKSYPIVVR